MGYFKKKLLVVLLLSSFIIFFVSSSTNATMQDITYTVDQPTLLKEQQEYLASVFLKRFNQYGTPTIYENLKTDLKNSYYWPLFSYVNLNNNPYLLLYLIPITPNYDNFDSYTLDTDDAYFYDYYMSYPVSGYSVSGSDFGQSSGFIRYVFNLSNNYNNRGLYTNTIFIPSSLIMYQNKTVNNFNNGINPSDSSIAMILNAIDDNTEEEEKATEELKKLNDFMSSDDVDDDSYDMPGYSDNPTQDITNDGVNSIFTQFYETISNWDSSLIVVPIPFTGKSFNIRPDITENIVNGFANRCS